MKLHLPTEPWLVEPVPSEQMNGSLRRINHQGHRIQISTACPGHHRPELVIKSALEAIRKQGIDLCDPATMTSVVSRLLRDVDSQGGMTAIVMLDAGEAKPGFTINDLTEHVKEHPC